MKADLGQSNSMIIINMSCTCNGMPQNNGTGRAQISLVRPKINLKPAKRDCSLFRSILLAQITVIGNKLSV